MGHVLRRPSDSGFPAAPPGLGPRRGEALRGSQEDGWCVRVHVDDERASAEIRQGVTQGLYRLAGGPREVVVVCVGTDRSTGDSLGPLTGHCLRALARHGAAVLGTLEDPVHAGNLAERLAEIRRLYPARVVIGVDACLGSLDNVGTICVATGALRPGAGVNKVLPPVGDLHVTGVVNVGGFMEYFVLQNTRLHLVMKMATVIAEGLADFLGRTSGGRAEPGPPGRPGRFWG